MEALEVLSVAAGGIPSRIYSLALIAVLYPPKTELVNVALWKTNCSKQTVVWTPDSCSLRYPIVSPLVPMMLSVPVTQSAASCSSATNVNSSCLSRQMATSLMDYPNRSEDLLWNRVAQPPLESQPHQTSTTMACPTDCRHTTGLFPLYAKTPKSFGPVIAGYGHGIDGCHAQNMWNCTNHNNIDLCLHKYIHIP